ncbi:hypothetical protein [Streptomyces erythrochromogenes]|uniref:hypothetical protein n=1 Tax=Streptomyces erythrochromogenes TaxID=285574 RepID=UPI0022568C20|nr:hypothetical protein [Streptomyces erythrochromogenes]MCX5584234.1 hypothetical protein [Streptomyces erythrochromogenes]
MTSDSYAIRTARSRWRQRRTALIQQGQWQPYTPAQPVRDHVNALRAAGMSPARISERTGVGVGTLNYLLFGDDGYPVPAQIRTESARTLMAFWPTLDDFADGARIDETGTLRRIQALATMGWLPAEIAKRTPLSKHTFFNMRPGRRVTAAVARIVRDFYQEYADKPAENCGVRLRSARYARTWATKNSYHAPIAWDDDTIEDPAAEPNYGETVPRYVAIAENCAELERLGHDRQQIAERLGITRDGLQRALSLYRQKTAAAA